MIDLKSSEKVAMLLNDSVRGTGTEHMGMDLRNISSGTKEEKIRRVAVQFEEMMINTLLKEAMKDGDKDNDGEESALSALSGGKQTYKDIRVMFLSQYIADSGGLGYRESIEEQIRLNYFRDDENIVQSIPNDRSAGPLPLSTASTVPAAPSFTARKSASAPPSPVAAPNPPGPEDPDQPMQTVSPVAGQVSSGYGWRKDPIDGKTRFHAGIDFEVPPHTPVKSFMKGEVTFSGWRRGYGRIVEITHPNGLSTRYAHNSELMVKEGDRVEAGKVIALSGSSGRSTGPHLHFEIRKGKFSLDPERMPYNTGGEFLAKK